MCVCVCLCVRSGAGTGGRELAKKGTKMRVKDEVLTLSEIFLAFFKSNQDLYLFKVQAPSAPWNSTGLMNMKSREKAESCNCPLFAMTGKVGSTIS